uniref:Retrovirus-related Pol polyprotein from transposon TNT 1-94-like beta-barrel domain-containing protein n=1 Tax=Cajanus cajan TaxID=3821 RepID=A0A151QQS5_CAJCA|nr:hypothetical protein KK1_046609 [Cajanus cajan]
MEAKTKFSQFFSPIFDLKTLDLWEAIEEDYDISMLLDNTTLKLISNVLYVSDINQNLLSVAQLLEKCYKVLFEDKNYVIIDINNKEVFNVHM